jgi:biotin synthase-like enzyme
MSEKAKRLIDFLSENHRLSEEEYLFLVKNRNEEISEYLRKKADEARKSVYGNKIFVRGLIEISNVCKNDCYYCGIRKSNKNCDRYKLSEEEILSMNVKQDDLLAVCDKHGVRRMSVVLFKRYYIKAIWGRKASVRETIHRKDNELNESLKRKED